MNKKYILQIVQLIQEGERVLQTRHTSISPLTNMSDEYLDDTKYEAWLVGIRSYLENYFKFSASAYIKQLDSIQTERWTSLIHRTKKMLELLKGLKGKVESGIIHPDSLPKEANINSVERKCPIVFLSHKSSDKEYGDALEKVIIGLGIKDNQLIYTSHPSHKIPLDENIYDYLRKHIASGVYIMFLWSDQYLDSPICLNEMGAAWLAHSDYTNFFVPGFNFENPKFRQCAVDTNRMGVTLNGDQHCKAGMIEFKNKLLHLFGLEIDEAKWIALLDEFLRNISFEKDANNRSSTIQYRAIGLVRFDRDYKDGEIIPKNVIDPKRIVPLIKEGKIERWS